MNRKLFAIFVAGGSGTRMGGDIPKQFIKLSGKPLLQLSIEKFLNACPDVHVITVLPERHFETWKSLCSECALDCPQVLVAGGLTRFHSVKNALERVPDGAIVAVHDGVRPFVSEDLIRRMVERMSGCRALIPVLPVMDTLRYRDLSLPDPDRSAIVRVQTPQMFLSEELKAAYGQAYDPSFTDDGSVARRYGIPLSFIDGERRNIKITVPEDLIP